MKHFLVIEQNNYADEFDIEGFKIYDANSEEELKNRILKETLEIEEDDEIEDVFPLEKYFGTNEYTEFYSPEDIFACLTIKEISLKEKTLLVKLFKNDKFGLTSVI